MSTGVEKIVNAFDGLLGSNYFLKASDLDRQLEEQQELLEIQGLLSIPDQKSLTAFIAEELTRDGSLSRRIEEIECVQRGVHGKICQLVFQKQDVLNILILKALEHSERITDIVITKPPEVNFSEKILQVFHCCQKRRMVSELIKKLESIQKATENHNSIQRALQNYSFEEAVKAVGQFSEILKNTINLDDHTGRSLLRLLNDDADSTAFTIVESMLHGSQSSSGLIRSFKLLQDLQREKDFSFYLNQGVRNFMKSKMKPLETLEKVLPQESLPHLLEFCHLIVTQLKLLSTLENRIKQMEGSMIDLEKSAASNFFIDLLSQVLQRLPFDLYEECDILPCTSKSESPRSLNHKTFQLEILAISQCCLSLTRFDPFCNFEILNTSIKARTKESLRAIKDTALQNLADIMVHETWLRFPVSEQERLLARFEKNEFQTLSPCLYILEHLASKRPLCKLEKTSNFGKAEQWASMAVTVLDFGILKSNENFKSKCFFTQSVFLCFNLLEANYKGLKLCPWLGNEIQKFGFEIWDLVCFSICKSFCPPKIQRLMFEEELSFLDEDLRRKHKSRMRFQKFENLRNHDFCVNTTFALHPSVKSSVRGYGAIEKLTSAFALQEFSLYISDANILKISEEVIQELCNEVCEALSGDLVRRWWQRYQKSREIKTPSLIKEALKESNDLLEIDSKDIFRRLRIWSNGAFPNEVWETFFCNWKVAIGVHLVKYFSKLRNEKGDWKLKEGELEEHVKNFKQTSESQYLTEYLNIHLEQSIEKPLVWCQRHLFHYSLEAQLGLLLHLGATPSEIADFESQYFQ